MDSRLEVVKVHCSKTAGEGLKGTGETGDQVTKDEESLLNPIFLFKTQEGLNRKIDIHECGGGYVFKHLYLD